MYIALCGEAVARQVLSNFASVFENLLATTTLMDFSGISVNSLNCRFSDYGWLNGLFTEVY